MYVLTVENLIKSYHYLFTKKEILHGVNLTVNEGEIYCFLGKNGAGKTTTIKSILSLVQYKGKISLFDIPAHQQLAREKIGFLPENAFLYENFSPLEMLDFSARLSGKTVHKPEELLDQVGLLNVVNQRVKTFSKGMKQRLGLACALVADPKLLILDEPVTGLDPLGRRLMKDILISLKNQGKSIFFSTHQLPDAEEFCDRAGILHNGVIEGEYTIEEIRKQEKSLEEFFIAKVTQ